MKKRAGLGPVFHRFFPKPGWFWEKLIYPTNYPPRQIPKKPVKLYGVYKV
jgi:hypothetical protein